MSKRRQTDRYEKAETYVEPDRSELASIHVQARPLGIPDCRAFLNLQFYLGSGSVSLILRMRLCWMEDQLHGVYDQ